MTNTSASALLIANRITGDKHPIIETETLFSPQRFTPKASAKEFFNHGANITFDFVSGNLDIMSCDLEEIKKEEGKILFLNGKALAVYRDLDGKLIALNHHCTHLKCPVTWNEQEKSWDCPCHGSRFDINGQILEGPALKPLERLEIEDTP